MKLALLGLLGLSEQILRARGGWSVWPVHEWRVVPTAPWPTSAPAVLLEVIPFKSRPQRMPPF